MENMLKLVCATFLGWGMARALTVGADTGNDVWRDTVTLVTANGRRITSSDTSNANPLLNVILATVAKDLVPSVEIDLAGSLFIPVFVCHILLSKFECYVLAAAT